MAGKKENIKALFSNTRTRVIILFTLILLLTIVIVGIVKFSKSTTVNVTTESGLRRTPYGIKSIPGALNQTAEYAKLQEEQNIEQAQQAAKTGSSAIPTIIRTQAFGEGVESVGAKQGEGSVGFNTLAREELGGPQNSLWLQSLQDSNCSKASITQVLSQGATIDDLRAACSCLQLKASGYGLSDLKAICTCNELKTAGFNIMDLKAAGFSAQKLRQCGFVACEEHGAGFTAQEMKDAGYSDGELKGAGFTDREIARAGGLPDGITADDVRKAGCDVGAIHRLQTAGVTAAAIRRISGCSADKLKAAGFSARDLRNAGFSAADLKNAGFTAAQLKQAGYEPRDLLNAGFTSDDLAAVGFTPAEIKAAENELPTNMTANDVRDAGCDAEALKRERLAGVSALMIRKHAGCSAAALKAAGFSVNDLKNAGFRAAEINAANPIIDDNVIRAAGCDPQKLHVLNQQGVTAKQIHDLNGCDVDALKEAGFDANDLLKAGFTPAALLAAKFTPAEINAAKLDDKIIQAAGCDSQKLKQLLLQGVSAKRIHRLNGCSAQALKNAGFDAKALANAGFTPEQLRAIGFTPEEIAAVQPVSENAIKEAGCDPMKLKVLFAHGVSAKRIHLLNGCNAQTLKNAGFDARSLLNAGFTPKQLQAAGFLPEEITAAVAANADALRAIKLTPADLQGLMLTPVSSAPTLSDNAIRAAGCDSLKLKKLIDQGVSAKQIHKLNGCTADALKAAGFDAKALADTGFSPAQLLAAGFSPAELTRAGMALTPAGVIASGRQTDCSVASLKAARTLGVSAATIKQTLGCSAEAMKAAGYSVSDLKDAGFTAAELKNAGFNAAELKSAGFNARDLRAAGFAAETLKALGFGAESLADAGFTPEELKQAGFTAAQLKAAGLTAAQLKAAGFNAADLRKAGYAPKDLRDAGFTAAQMKNAGYSNQDLRDAGFTPEESSLAGLEALETTTAPPSTLASVPSVEGATTNKAASQISDNTKQLQQILDKQQKDMAEQRYQQKIQQRKTVMMTAANQSLQGWKSVATQHYLASSIKEKTETEKAVLNQTSVQTGTMVQSEVGVTGRETPAVIKTGDILFAVIDTSVNSDEPGPILATIVSGRLKGSKLIGSFNLPSNADKMVISFNTLSVPGASKTVTISAFAIDANTARTALSSQTDHHYLSRYGSLFAATFLEGFGNAFQSADTTITVGGTGDVANTTVQNGIGRSALENAVIGLATVGKAWGQVAQQNMSRPTTVQVYSGTGIGVLFTQDLATI